MLDPFHIPRRFNRNSTVDRCFTTRQGPLRIWIGLLCKDSTTAAHHDVDQDTYTAMWILRGETLYQDDEVRQISAVAGDLLCRLPRRRHSTVPVAGSGLVEFFVHLEVGWFRRLAALGAVPAQPHSRLGWDPGLADRCLSFLERLPRMPDTSWPLALAEAQGLLAAFSVGCSNRLAPDELMIRACDILSSDLPGRLRLAGIANQLGIGVESFRKRFVAATGLSPGAWRIRRRIDSAQAHLLAGNISLMEIAARLGYADMPAFVKQFHRLTGLPPAAWKRAQHGCAR